VLQIIYAGYLFALQNAGNWLFMVEVGLVIYKVQEKIGSKGAFFEIWDSKGR